LAVGQLVFALVAVTDPMHALLLQRADELEGCPKGSVEEAELEVIVDAIEAYEAKRWPLGKEPVTDLAT
jgi:hypothetical protein